MSKAFGFTNTTDSTKVTITPTDLKVVSNYAVTEDEANICRLANVTCPLDQPEVLTYQCQDITNVNTSIKNQYPPLVKDGIQYSTKLETLLSIQDADPNHRVDLPIVAQLSIRHSKNGNITETDIQTIIDRLVGSLYSTGGTCRLTAMMRQSLKPSND